MKLFKKPKYVTVTNPSRAENALSSEEQKPNIPNGLWVKCGKCGQALYKRDLEQNQMVCQHCNAHIRLSAPERISSIIDAETFEEFDKTMKSANPLEFEGYKEKVEALIDQTELNEAVITGKGKVNGIDTVICVMDSRFMMGSMGSVVGEKITRAIEKATELEVPVVIFTASGGARMQEGIFSLMQMAKVSAALKKHDEKGLLYITVLTDPTTGGVTASFAMLGDIIISEPNALIGFAGRRVIEQTIRQKLPEEFQSAEFLLEHGFIDMIVNRKKLKDILAKILILHKRG